MRATSPVTPMTSSAWAALILLSMLWGGSFFFIEIAVERLPPLSVVAFRLGFAAVALNLWLVLRGRTLPRDRSTWKAFAAMGLLNNLIPFALIAWGQTRISGSLASILNASTPIFTVMVAHFWTADEKLSAAKLVGVLAGFAGVAVLLGPDALAGMASHVIAQTACLGAALFYAVAGVYGRRFSRLGIAPITAATGQLTASAAMLFPVALAVDKTWTVISPDPVTWSAIGASALLSTALAFVLYFRVLGRFGATNLLLVTLLIPASATTLGFVFLGEHLSGRHVIGMAAIAIGLAVIDGRVWAVTRRAI